MIKVKTKIAAVLMMAHVLIGIKGQTLVTDPTTSKKSIKPLYFQTNIDTYARCSKIYCVDYDQASGFQMVGG